MSADTAPEIVLSLEIDDPALANRLATLLGGVAGLRLAAPGETAAATIVARDPRVMPDDIALTQRELDVLALMAEGRSNTAIAQQLFVTEKAVSKHTTSIFTKLGLTASEDDNRRVLAVLAYLNS